MAKELVKKGKKTIVVNNDIKTNVKTDAGLEKEKLAEKPAVEKEKEKDRKAEDRLLEERVLGQMKTLNETGVPITSTLLRDKLGLDKENGRDQIRKIAKRLEAEGKITTGEKTVGKLKRYVYSLKEQVKTTPE